jgi:glycosyltransferase involved in cell wall biosynthesis
MSQQASPRGDPRAEEEEHAAASPSASDGRCRLVAVAWADFQPRTRVLAQELGGEAHFIASPARPPLRYVINALRTWSLLERRRPRWALVITPPVFAPLTIWAWCALRHRDFVVDCHTGAFHSPRWAWARPLHRLLLRRARAVTLHTESATSLVAGWGLSGLLLPDDVPSPADAAAGATSGAEVVVAGSLDHNEPVEEALRAAARMPEVRFAFTGDTARLSAQARAAIPPNALMTGFLPYATFLAELRAARVVAVFSTDPEIMNRAAFETVGLGRPLVLSDLPGLRSRFGEAAVFAANDPDSMAAAVREALASGSALAERTEALGGRLRAQRAQGMEQLRRALEEPPALPAGRPGGRRRRVLMITQHAYPRFTVVARNVHFLLSQGIEVDLICQTLGEQEPPPRPGLRVFSVPVTHRRSSPLRYVYEYAAFFIGALAIGCRLSLRRSYTAVQVDNMPDFLVFAALPARLRGARVVLNMLEIGPEMTAARLGADGAHPAVRAARWFEKAATRWAHRVITVSDPCRRVLAERGLSGDKVTVLPNTVTRSRHDRDPLAVAARPFLVTHATLIERYGVQVAIRAMSRLREAWPDLTLRVLGDGEYAPQLERLAAELGLEKEVVFTGGLPWDAAMSHVASATLGLVPIIPDGYGQMLLPTKLMEYVEHEVPVVASRLPTIEEYFPEDAVAYFDAGDPAGLAAEVDRLLRDPAAARRQAERAREVARSLSWATVSVRYLEALGLRAEPA